MTVDQMRAIWARAIEVHSGLRASIGIEPLLVMAGIPCGVWVSHVVMGLPLIGQMTTLAGLYSVGRWAVKPERTAAIGAIGERVMSMLSESEAPAALPEEDVKTEAEEPTLKLIRPRVKREDAHVVA